MTKITPQQMRELADTEVEYRRQTGYEAVWASGCLAGSAEANARIWRAVYAALESALPFGPMEPVEETDD